VGFAGPRSPGADVLQKGDVIVVAHAFVTVDQAGVIAAWSEGAEKLFGHPSSEAVGRTLDLIVPESHRERHWAGFHALLGSVTAETEWDRGAVVVPVLQRDGTVLPAAVRLVVLRDALDRAAGAVGVFIADPPSADEWSHLPAL
jgi:PAS domain S-box-containing protein